MKQFFAELTRRNVVRVSAAYVIVGWIVLQVVSVLMPALHLPDWMLSVAFTILLIGFPVAMLLTWAFELTPQGVRKVEAGARTPAPSSKALDLGLLAIAALLVAVTVLRPPGAPGELASSGQETSAASLDVARPALIPVQAPEASIAVLAFANMSGNPENEYFSDGISEEILNALASIKSIRVSARTSAFSFKGKSEDVRVIGEALDVATVLEGSVRRIDNRVRITAQLNNAASGYHMWSQTYDRELTDIFAIQEEIALAITEALKIELNLEEKKDIVRLGTDDMAAYSAYLKGRKALQTKYFYDMWKFEAHLKKAVELDPDYSDAWGALAVGYASMLISTRPFSSYRDDLAEAFSTALSLAPDNHEALAAKAFYIVMTTHNWREAGTLYRRALAAEHNGTIVGVYLNNYLLPLGRNVEAVTVVKNNLRLDPLNSGLRRWAVVSHSHPGRNNEFALEQLDGLTAAGEETAPFLCRKAGIFALLDRRDEALETLARVRSMDLPWSMEHPFELYACAQANYTLGRLDQFNILLAKLKHMATDQFVARVSLFTLYSAVGDFDAWMDLANDLLDTDSAILLYVRNYQDGFGENASDPRFQQMLKAVRLDDASLAEMGMTWGEPADEQAGASE